MRTIAKYTGATIVGLNNNDYQLQRLALHNKRNKLDHLCSGVKGDFLRMSFPSNSFDAAYAFEATCHAANRVEVLVLCCNSAFFFSNLRNCPGVPRDLPHAQARRPLCHV